MSNPELTQALTDFLEKIERGGNSEEDISRMMRGLEAFVPNVGISDIIFYGERHRTPKEIADEAILREAIWAEGGQAAVDARIGALMRAALADPVTDKTRRYLAMQILESLERDSKRRPN